MMKSVVVFILLLLHLVNTCNGLRLFFQVSYTDKPGKHCGYNLNGDCNHDNCQFNDISFFVEGVCYSAGTLGSTKWEYDSTNQEIKWYEYFSSTLCKGDNKATHSQTAGMCVSSTYRGVLQNQCQSGMSGAFTKRTMEVTRYADALCSSGGQAMPQVSDYCWPVDANGKSHRYRYLDESTTIVREAFDGDGCSGSVATSLTILTSDSCTRDGNTTLTGESSLYYCKAVSSLDSQHQHSSDSNSHVGVILGVLFGCLGAIGLSAFVYYMYKRQQKLEATNPEYTQQENFYHDIGDL